MVKIRDALREGKARLRKADLDLSELEAEALLMHTLATDRGHLYKDLGEPISDDNLDAYRRLLDRRCAHEPTVYIAGHREFFGLDFRVTPAALIPRPETEASVEAVIDFARENLSGRDFTMADVGVGCGAIAVAVSYTLSNARVTGIDQSEEALVLAEENARKHGVADRITFVRGDLLDPLKEPVDVIAANLPYVSTSDWEELPPELRDNEPRIAFDGGGDGLSLIRRFLVEAPSRLRPGGALFSETGDGQAGAVLALARDAFPAARIVMALDLAGTPRVLCVYT